MTTTPQPNLRHLACAAALAATALVGLGIAAAQQERAVLVADNPAIPLPPWPQPPPPAVPTPPGPAPGVQLLPVPAESPLVGQVPAPAETPTGPFQQPEQRPM